MSTSELAADRQVATDRTGWYRFVVLAVIMGCQLMMVLDTSIVTTALPHLERDLGFTATSLSWVQNSYALAFGGLLLLGARAGDLLGRRRVFMAGVAVFTLASLLAGLAPNPTIMITARVLQGLAAAFAIPTTLALLVQTFPKPEERSRAISIYSAVIGAGGSVGIIIGGIFTDLLSWRWGLLINVPIGIIVLLLAPKFLPETTRSRGSFDVPGALTITIGMSALVYGLVNASEAGWESPITIVSLSAAALFIIAFIVIERRASQPITPLRLFRDVTRTGAYIARILIVGAMFSTFYFLSQYLQNVLGFSAFLAGISYIPLTLMFFATVYVIRPLSKLIGKPALLLVSLVVALLGMLWLSTIGPETPYFPGVVLPLIVLGTGQGIAIILLTEFGMSNVAPEDNGAASGLVNTAHQLGGSIGLAVLTVIFGAAAGSSATPHSPADAHAYSAVFGASVWFYAIAVVAAAIILVASRRTTVRVR
ncbi:DHA2 family efflux MFS transporter permease subunit [Rhodococcus sp. NPDC056743]|uniref:DHA2 family efflux MFS transporter permease subunit n=1 Tax=Rhodococcus sp. NPDC056743 TaxID=3345934 RepID=UPI00366F390F